MQLQSLQSNMRCALMGAALAVLLSGCSSIVSNVTQSFADSLAGAILDNEDLAMVRDGAPAYLILIDSLVARSPDDAYLLQQSAILHGAYAGAFVSDEARARRLQTKARSQALQAACLTLPDACGLETLSYRRFTQWVDARDADDVPMLYTLGTSWAGWVQAHSDDFTAIADLAKVKAVISRAAELQPDYESGGLYLYLGVLETLFPPAMGGKPEIGRGHFEEAIRRSEGQNLLAKVLFAEQYARLVFDRELHDQLLTEVLDAPAMVPGLTLMNMVAKEQAQQLMESADDYF